MILNFNSKYFFTGAVTDTGTLLGWFDSVTFLSFLKMWEKHFRRQKGKRVLIGDNTRTHHSVEAVEFCRSHNVAFVCFPPNATDKLQPLDVGVFRAVKELWRALLRRYGNEDPNTKVMEKTLFLRFLAELLRDLNPEQKLINAFAKTGIFPLDPEKPLQNIPDCISSDEIAGNIDQGPKDPSWPELYREPQQQ